MCTIHCSASFNEINEYHVPKLNIQNGVLNALSFLFEYIGRTMFMLLLRFWRTLLPTMIRSIARPQRVLSSILPCVLLVWAVKML